MHKPKKRNLSTQKSVGKQNLSPQTSVGKRNPSPQKSVDKRKLSPQKSVDKRKLSPEKSVDWLQYMEDCLPGLVIPVGSRFQVDVPEWTGPCNVAHSNGDIDNSKWLGTIIWSLQDSRTLPEGDGIGKGRPDYCSCSSPGTSQCVKQHISDARTRLQSELGPAYEMWNFDQMGEDVGKSWTPKQKKKFDQLVRTNPLSQDKSFLQPAQLAFQSKTRKDIVSYYLNVYVPKRISMITRSGCKEFDSDGDEVEEVPNAKNSNKRLRPNHVDITQLVKSHYLIGRR